MWLNSEVLNFYSGRFPKFYLGTSISSSLVTLHLGEITYFSFAFAVLKVLTKVQLKNMCQVKKNWNASDFIQLLHPLVTTTSQLK